MTLFPLPRLSDLSLAHWKPKEKVLTNSGLSVPEVHEVPQCPSNIEWDLTTGPLSKLLELLDTQVYGSVHWVLLDISWTMGSPQILWKLHEDMKI